MIKTAIARLAYPVFATGSRPIDYRARTRIDAIQVPVRCAGVTSHQAILC